MMFGIVNNNCEAVIKVVVGRIGSSKIGLAEKVKKRKKCGLGKYGLKKHR